MGLIQKLKSALGLDGADSPDSGTAAPRDVDVTVEREPSSESEDAVKGTETAASRTSEREESDVGVGTGESSEAETPIEEAEPDAGESPVQAVDDETVQTEIEDVGEGATDAATEESTADAPIEDAEVEEEVPAADDEEASDESDGDTSAESEDAGSTEDLDEGSVEDDGTEAAAADVPDDPVTEISGIGPAYGQRLSDAGVETVADLAAADPDELESATDISAARIEGWIDAAAEY
ncbi:Helix-hairpin-helix domain-containing protein [Halomicrobium zhouii]|uniref:Helix-hairpin-helix domain-containing protein n=1 Tax=Halomicrobium zhouii TaxID=767519 RepID=A0A1I6LBC8_9EURY|nr:helix-hairpin-helix domain-containing protein [Halomicrobium zhouii]SFS00729.1 Helix-hairpin-helix domain-containing protein [Halomicrobium zhouii]